MIKIDILCLACITLHVSYLREVVTEELVDVLAVERLPFVEEYSVHVVNERTTVTQHRHVLLVYVLRCIDFVPRKGSVQCDIAFSQIVFSHLTHQ